MKKRAIFTLSILGLFCIASLATMNSNDNSELNEQNTPPVTNVSSYSITLTVGEKVTFTKNVKEGDTIDWTDLSEPSKIGYIFSGWDFGDGVVTKNLPTIMLNQNINATAVFSKDPNYEFLNVTFYNYDGETVLLATEVPKTKVYTNILALYTNPIPSKASSKSFYYTFLGWNDDRTANEPLKSFAAITSSFMDIKLYAIYEANYIINDNDQTDETRQMIEKSYFDTTRSWSRQTYVSHGDPDTMDNIFYVTEEKYNATLESYYRKVTKLEQNYKNKEKGWYDSDTKTYIGGIVVQEIVMDKNIGYFDILSGSFKDWKICLNESGVTYEEYIRIFITRTSSLNIDTGDGTSFLVEEMKVFANLDEQGHTNREADGSVLFVEIQDNYKINVFTYNGFFITNAEYYDWETNKITHSFDVSFSMSVTSGTRGSSTYEFGLNYEDVGDLMSIYREKRV